MDNEGYVMCITECYVGFERNQKYKYVREEKIGQSGSQKLYWRVKIYKTINTFTSFFGTDGDKDLLDSPMRDYFIELKEYRNMKIE